MPTLAEMIEPMPGKVVVQIKSADEVTKGGLYLPIETVRSQHEGKATQGTVIAIGLDEDLEEPEPHFKVGNTVVFGKYSGTELRYRPPREEEANVLERKPTPPEERILVMFFKDILAVIRRPEEAGSLQVRG